MTWKRFLIGLIIGLVLIGVPVGIYIYLDDSEPPSHRESDLSPLDHPVVAWVWSGAVTTNSAVVKARLPATVEVRLAVQASPDLNEPHYVIPTRTTEEDGIAVFALTELEPDTEYYYAFELDGVLDRTIDGRFHTFGEGAYSFVIALGNGASTGSNGAVFDTIRSHEPLFFLHLGDLHYENIIFNNPAIFHDAYDQVLASPSQSLLYRSHPIVYIWDDHDFGPNNSTSQSPSAEAARQAYEEAVPHYPLGPGGINQAFSVGRVRFIMMDARSQRVRQEATILGAEQKAWLKEELLQAKDDHALIVLVNSVPWIAEEDEGFLWRGDSWGGYPDERRELADFLAENEINNLVMFAGDAHMLAIDDGSNTNYATGSTGPAFPLLHAASMDREGSVKGGPYSMAPIPGGGQFAVMRVTDTGEMIEVEWTGHDYLDNQLLGLRFNVEPDGISNRTVLE
jgi:phosphodiesterase/alkaline phosphatase D-like protein